MMQRSTGDAPISLAAKGAFAGLPVLKPQCAQFAYAGPCAFPLFPLAQPQPTENPLVELLECPDVLCEPEVLQPTPDEAIENRDAALVSRLSRPVSP